MSFNQKEDFNRRVAKRVKLTDEKDLSISQMISIIRRGDEGIDEYFARKIEKPIEERPSMLNDFQL